VKKAGPGGVKAKAGAHPKAKSKPAGAKRPALKKKAGPTAAAKKAVRPVDPGPAPVASLDTPPAALPGATPKEIPAPAAAPLPAPPALDEIPFEELSRDAASAFLYAALLPAEALELVKQLGLTRPGFRPEKLGEVECCDLLADELRAGPESRPTVLAALRHGLKEPAFATSSLDPAAAEELLEVAGSDHGLAIALWRLVADPSREVRQRGGKALEQLAAEWYGPGPAGAVPPAPGAGRAGGPAAQEDPGQQLRALKEQVSRAEAKAEEIRQRGEAQREKLQAQLKEARAEAARAVEEGARSREAAEAARAAQGRAEVALGAARASDAVAEAGRLRAALREAEVRLHAAEAQVARAGEREAALQAALLGAEARATDAGETSQGPREAGPEEPEEAPATWLLPVFSPEFYDSLVGWDRRIQRAALKQAFLLSQDWRHPSLRALALEGLPGYYRVRVATDVRLIYRRGERQDTVELCSLIDREDLDRYVRQAKTR